MDNLLWACGDLFERLLGLVGANVMCHSDCVVRDSVVRGRVVAGRGGLRVRND